MRRTLSALLASALFAVGTPVSAESQLTAIDATGLSDALAAVRTESSAGSEGPVVLVNFWATWCKPCREEIPIFLDLEKQYGGEGFRLIAVSLDEIETMENTVAPFMQKWFPEFTSYISVEYDMDDMVSVVDQGWNEVLPTSYLYARDGSLSERLQGKYTAEEFTNRIRALLEQ